MPSKSPAQAKLMRAVAHGWKPDRIKGPSRSVAREFANADRKYSGGFAENRYWTGGLAAMNEINSGVPQTLNFQEGGSVGTGYLDYYGNEPQVLDLGDFRDVLKIGAMQAEGWQFEEATGTMYPPLWNIETGGLEQTILGETQPTTTTTAPTTAPATTGIGTPYVGYTGGMAWDWGGYGNYDDWRQAMIDNGTISPESDPAPVRDIPGAAPQPGDTGDTGDTTTPPKWTPEQIATWNAQQTAKERQSPYRDQLREHQVRVADALKSGSVPTPEGGGTGGDMMYPGGTPGFYAPGGPGRGGQLDIAGNYTDETGYDPKDFSADAVAARRQAESAYLDSIGYEQPWMTAGAKGGYMNYQEGGSVPKPPTGGGAPVPGHQEGTNPYTLANSPSRYRMWENKYHVAPPPPPPPPPPEEEPGWWESLFAPEEARKTRTERELEAMGEARGGYMRGYRGGGRVRGYQGGGLAMAAPVGGIPPWAESPEYVEPQGYQVGGPTRWSPQQQASWRGARGNPAARSAMGQQYRQQQQALQNRAPQQAGRAGMMANAQRQQQAMQQRAGQAGRMGQAQADFAAQRALPQQQAGGLAAMQQQAQQQALAQRGGRGAPAYGSKPQPGMSYAGGTPGFYGPGGPGGGGQTIGGQGIQYDPRAGNRSNNVPGALGGPKVPPNMRGFLQKQRMQNRPPPNVGGGVNRVGQQDQQGAQARAMQRGTGRRPMSRRGGFPGGGMR